MLGIALTALEEETIIAVEPWANVESEAQVIGQEHFDEVEQGTDPRRKFKLDLKLMRDMERLGILLLITARVNGELAGYFTWFIVNDCESDGLLIAQQGAWFVRARYARGHLGIKMFKRSIEEMKSRGVKCIFPHHRMMGRGSRLGLLFRRLGAVLTQQTYMLWIGD